MCIPSERAVFRTAPGLKCALSRRMRVVFSEIAVARPPMTPARATGFTASAITRCCGVSVRSTPSSVTSISPAFARRTTIVGRPSAPFASVSRSKAWSGCPMSQRTWFVASTGDEIALCPIAASREATVPLAGRTAIPSITRAEYREQSAGSSTTTAARVSTAGPFSGTGTAASGSAKARRRATAASRARPRWFMPSGRFAVISTS